MTDKGHGRLYANCYFALETGDSKGKDAGLSTALLTIRL